MIVSPHVDATTGSRSTLLICPRTGHAGLVDPLPAIRTQVEEELTERRATLIWHLHTQPREEQPDPTDEKMVALLKRLGVTSAEPMSASWGTDVRVVAPLAGGRAGEVQFEIDGEVRSMKPADTTNWNEAPAVGLPLGTLVLRAIPRRDSQGAPRMAFACNELVLLGHINNASIIPELLPGIGGRSKS